MRRRIVRNAFDPALRRGPLDRLFSAGAAFFGYCGRFFFRVAERIADQAGFAGRLLFVALENRDYGARLFRLALMEVYRLVSSSSGLIVLVGVMMGYLWSFLWFDTLSNIGGVENIGAFLVNIHGIHIAPIMTTVIVIMRYGAPITWELAIMKSGGHVRNLAAQGLAPELQLAAPRIIGAFLATPILLTLFIGASFIGSYYIAWKQEGQAMLEFMLNLTQKTEGRHYAVMALKSAAISLTVSFFCVYNAFCIEEEDLRQGTVIIRRAMGEAFFYSILSGNLVSIVYKV